MGQNNMLRAELGQLKSSIYDMIKEEEKSQLELYDQLIMIFWEVNDEFEVKKWIKLKEEFLREIEVRSNRVYLDVVNDLEAYGCIK